jgi:hypothetical protein
VPTCLIFIGLASQRANFVVCLFSSPSSVAYTSPVLEWHSFFFSCLKHSPGTCAHLTELQLLFGKLFPETANISQYSGCKLRLVSTPGGAWVEMSIMLNHRCAINSYPYIQVWQQPVCMIGTQCWSMPYPGGLGLGYFG